MGTHDCQMRVEYTENTDYILYEQRKLSSALPTVGRYRPEPPSMSTLAHFRWSPQAVFRDVLRQPRRVDVQDPLSFVEPEPREPAFGGLHGRVPVLEISADLEKHGERA